MAKKPDFKALAKRAGERKDQSQTNTGGGDFVPAPAGTTVARFVDYIEVGLQKQRPYNGREKPPAEKVYVTFELLGAKYVRTIEVNGKNKEIADRITIPLTVSLHEKSSFKKLFKKMLYGRDGINHMSQMLGEAFKVTVTHNVTGEGDKKRTYVNLTDDEGVYLVGAPVKQETDDEGNVTGTKKLAVRESVNGERMFVWDEPTQECWDSIFIDGDKEITDEKGKKKTVSKNRFQNEITSALNFEGSPIQAFLEGSEDLSENPEELADEEEIEEEVELEEEVEEEVEETEEEELEEEEEETPPPAKKAVAKAAPAKAVAPAKKSSASVASTSSKSVPTAAAKSSTAKPSAKPATTSPSKAAPGKVAKPKASADDDALKALGLA